MAPVLGPDGKLLVSSTGGPVCPLCGQVIPLRSPAGIIFDVVQGKVIMMPVHLECPVGEG